jgi:HSP20 family protein|tara:strand:- start:2283 stop:2738 length:456 start_codon:yes stop_codon:yes gene_type:complete
MFLQPWSPFRELRRFNRVANQQWRGYPRYAVETPDPDHWSLAVDVVEADDALRVTASVPGIKPEDIEVTIESDILTIKGETDTAEIIEGEEPKDESYRLRERRTGHFYRTLRLPDTLDTDNAATSYENGVLTITLPKSEAKKAKRLTVATA